MELSKLRSYLEREAAEMEQQEKESEHMFSKLSYQIEEIESRVKKIESEFDFAYEAFSPVSRKHDKSKQQIEELNQGHEELEKRQELCRRKQEYYHEKKDRAEAALKELEVQQEENEEQLQELHEKFSRTLGVQIIEMQEQERQRIARELHDTTVQNMTALIHKMEFCQQIMEMDPIRARLEMQLMRQTIRETVDNMREVIYNLRPMSFDDIGFLETLQRAVERLQKNTDIKIIFETRGEMYRTSPAYELTILRIMQEAVNNSRKYSQAELMKIILTYESDQIILAITDDGNGFDTEEEKTEIQNCGFGIPIMKERVHLLKGYIKIHSEKNKGTEIWVTLPRKEPEDTDDY